MMPRLESLPLTLTLGVGVLTAVLTYRWLFRRKNKTELNSAEVVKAWLPVARVSSLEIFPVKSCRGVKVSEAECSQLGLQSEGKLQDRRFMVVNENGNFLHARLYPKMLLIQPQIVGNQIKLSAPDMPALAIDIPSAEDSSLVRVVKIWGEEVPATDCGSAAAVWLSRYILRSESGARLVYHASDNTERQIKPKHIFPWMRQTDGAAFQDLAPYLLLSQASVSDLVSQLPEGETASADNFRPTVVVSGCPAYAEDKWTFIRIGNEVVLRAMKPCDRCALTAIDPKTGVKNPNLEPLKTLKRYRMARDPEVRTSIGESPLFGVNFALDKPGTIRVGDLVYAGEVDM